MKIEHGHGLTDGGFLFDVIGFFIGLYFSLFLGNFFRLA